MLEARRLLDTGEPLPFTVVAERQSGGVGRLGRPWSSPPGGWWLTVAVALVSGRRSLRDDTALGIALHVRTVCEAALSISGRPHEPVRIKWPNDIMAGDLKLAGILIEVVQSAAGPVALIGIGVNADMEHAALEESIRDRATTLAALTGSPLDPRISEYSIASLAEKAVAAVEWAPQRGAIAEMTRPHLWGIGRTVPITLPDGARTLGRIDGLTSDGNLLATIDGEQRTLRSVDQIG